MIQRKSCFITGNIWQHGILVKTNPNRVYGIAKCGKKFILKIRNLSILLVLISSDFNVEKDILLFANHLVGIFYQFIHLLWIILKDRGEFKVQIDTICRSNKIKRPID